MTGERARGERRGALWRLASLLLSCTIPLVLLSSAIRIEMNSLGLYTRGFRIYDVSRVTGLGDEILQQAAARLIHYFNFLADTPQMLVGHATGAQFELYHDYELIHLADVRILFAANSLMQAVSLLIILVLVSAGMAHGRRLETLTGLRRGALGTLALLVATGLLFLLDFGRMFTLFHVVAFDNPFWLLDPLTDYLVMLFPFGFWQDMFLFAGASTGVAAIILYVLTTRGLRVIHSASTNDSPSDAKKRDV
ncbi:MAG: TIGR01906 family membrane protein [Dehalococcoidia bacterium]|nr:TIGR01906 family membrane protein [Dehalococcoidia bacterium]